MSELQNHELYVYSALFLREREGVVTVESLKAIFEHLGLDFSHKLASQFIMPVEEYDRIISNMGSASSVCTTADNGAAKVEEKVEEEKKEEANIDGDVEVDFDDMFG
ncbi:hypothetical protein CWI36_1389p0010 [Hamiltosporidium magnivora]|uniref:Uncharacterized protein n=1 Tax=Hamiltosporidium magnivora TaxID=148818 RepID=A0A4Q9L413_9MICR|nr:hypothetical protein CWI36_1389p0010 [Hamiltosporidium magnivora]